MQWSERWNFIKPIDLEPRASGSRWYRGAHHDAGRVDLVDHAGRGKLRSTAPESRATRLPCQSTTGSERTRGTASACMLDPQAPG